MHDQQGNERALVSKAKASMLKGVGLGVERVCLGVGRSRSRCWNEWTSMLKTAGFHQAMP